MTVRVAINGFGRTGRSFLRAALTPDRDLEIVAINDLGPPEALARLFARDSVHGRYPEGVTIEGTTMIVGQRRLAMLAEPEAKALPWGELGIDVVAECTGKYTKRERAAEHLGAGAVRVVISAPADNPDATFVVGVNEDQFDAQRHFIISNAVVHDELPRSLGKGARRLLRHCRRIHDDGARVHR